MPRAASPRAASQREREGLTAEGRFEEQLRSTRALASLEASRSAQLLREEQLRRARVEHEWLSLQRASELQLARPLQREPLVLDARPAELLLTQQLRRAGCLEGGERTRRAQLLLESTLRRQPLALPL